MEESKKSYLDILQRILISHGENHQFVVNCFEKLALIEKKLGNYKTSIEHYTKVIQIIRRLNGNEYDLSTYLIQLADVKRKIDDFNGADVDYKSVLSSIKNEHDKLLALRGLGIICKKRCDYDSALKYYDTCIKILEKNNEKNHDLAILYVDIGDIYRKREQHSQAINFYEIALGHLNATGGENTLDGVDIYYSMSLSLIAINKVKDADLFLEKATFIINQIRGPHYKKGLILASMGMVKSFRGLYHDAEKDFENALKILLETLGPDHLEVADTRVKLVEANLKHQEETHNMDNFNELINHVNSAMNIYIKKFESSHYKIKECETYLYYLKNNII